ncbi:hypothetical protein [Mycobacteroides abscessus]|uniref:hypothetical protein n=1 Tax=Mycobacteroides abscessus TaxID=36809 RepID=UPI0019D00D99|nr:hypothetical protein [Mycobacteroides abscessus]
MPREHEALAAYPAIQLEHAHLDGEQLQFESAEGFDRALAQGFFLLRIPEALDTEPGDQFAAHFYQDRAGDELDR